MNAKEFKQFLVKAKKNTYALNGESKEKKLSDGSKELIFKENDFKYKDRYFGSKQFIGEEIVYYKNKPVWGMNYKGGINSDIIPYSDVYNFLKECLRKVNSIKPFRGPGGFKRDNLKYVNKVKGSIDSFIGEESILYKGKTIYKLNYQGGFINK